MPASRSSSVLSSLAAGARALAGRLDAYVGGGVAPQPAPVNVAPAPTVAAPATRRDGAPTSVMDCGPGGCGGGAAGLWDTGPVWAATTPSLDRSTIDNICTDELMRRIVDIMVGDCMRDKPTLAGDSGELSGCFDWLEARGFWAEAERALTYSRQYGGGGVVCFIDDGRPADEEVDVLAIRDVVGFYALPKWYLVPDGVGSGRVRSAWYGVRIGRPEHYFVTPSTALATYVGRDEAGSRRLPNDLRRILNKSGNRFHRSRIIPWPYRPEMDLRQARWQPFWNGWGPGVVESCLAPFLARRSGALRLAAIMQSVVVNTLTINDLEARQSQPDLMAALQGRLEFIKWCRDFMSDSLPIIATDTSNRFDSLTHNVSGIDKLVAAQRQFLLDVLEYPAVVLFGDSVGGLNGGDRAGEWRAWDRTVAAKRKSWVWTAGAFGGGLRQAVALAMLTQRGPTSGQYDPTVTPTWPSLLDETAEDVAKNSLLHAQRRAQDALTLGLTPQAIARLDPTVKATYPALDVDEGPLPVLAEPAPPLSAGAQGTTPAMAASDPAAPATTPGATNKALAEEREGGEGEQQADAPPVPVMLPNDIRTEREVAAALGLTTGAFRKWADLHKVTTYPMPPGTRGGHRYSLGEVMRAWQAAAIRRADGARMY